MVRSIVVGRDINAGRMLTESAIDDESRVQELIMAHPDLIPLDDMGIGGPVSVIARRTRSEPGFPELLAVSRMDQVVIIKFLPACHSTDASGALGQLLDCGSDVWSFGWEPREQRDPVSLLQARHRHDRCLDIGVRSPEGSRGNLDQDDCDHDQQTLELLQSGQFHYVLLAQRFAESTLQTIEYLNHISNAHFHAVEALTFRGAGSEAFEARVIVRPTVRKSTGGRVPTNQDRLARKIS